MCLRGEGEHDVPVSNIFSNVSLATYIWNKATSVGRFAVVVSRAVKRGGCCEARIDCRHELMDGRGMGDS